MTDDKRLIEIAIVQGAEGPSLQVLGKTGGRRVAGPKAWGNVYNKPVFTFIVNSKELIAAIKENEYE